MTQLNFFENIMGLDGVANGVIAQGSLFFGAVHLHGDLSFNKVNVIFNYARSTTNTITVQFGLYSLNGSTLSLANSASRSFSWNASTVTSFISLATSATQNITEGDWWFGVVASVQTANGTRNILVDGNILVNLSLQTNVGLPLRGAYSATTNAMPSSLNTSQINKMGEADDLKQRMPYVLISA